MRRRWRALRYLGAVGRAACRGPLGIILAVDAVAAGLMIAETVSAGWWR